MDLATVLMFLALLEEGQGAQPGPGNLPGPIPSPQPYVPPAPAPYVPPAPQPAPAPPRPAPAPAPSPVRPKPMPIGPPKPAPAPVRPKPMPVPKPFPTPVQPQGLPPFPGPQWTACPTTAAIVARAVYWNAILWDFPSKTIRQATAQEQLGGQWVTFKAAWHPDASGNPQGLMATEAYCLGGAAPPAPPPGPAPLNSIEPVGPEPELGGWQTDVAFIKRYQASLSLLSFTQNQPSWNTQGVDGSAGPNTMAAVKAFQAAQGLAVDGEVGSATASAIDTMQGFTVPPGGYPPPSAGGGGGSAYPASPGS